MSKRMPDAQEFFTEFPIYKTIDITNNDSDEVADITHYKGSIDCICPFCDNDKNNSVFTSTVERPIGSRQLGEHSIMALTLLIPGSNFIINGEEQKFNYKDNYYDVKFKCARNENHIISFPLLIVSNKLMKIGQFPSLNHIKNNNYDRYEPIIGKENVSFLKGGEISYSMHLGSGALIYLRKVFEKIIGIFHDEAKGLSDWTPEKESEFKDKRLAEKLEMLEQLLPSIIVENKTTYYAVLSDGIHNKTEIECMESYNILKSGLDYILDEMLLKKEKEKAKQKFKSSLNKIHSQNKS